MKKTLVFSLVTTLLSLAMFMSGCATDGTANKSKVNSNKENPSFEHLESSPEEPNKSSNVNQVGLFTEPKSSVAESKMIDGETDYEKPSVSKDDSIAGMDFNESDRKVSVQIVEGFVPDNGSENNQSTSMMIDRNRTPSEVISSDPEEKSGNEITSESNNHGTEESFLSRTHKQIDMLPYGEGNLTQNEKTVITITDTNNDSDSKKDPDVKNLNLAKSYLEFSSPETGIDQDINSTQKPDRKLSRLSIQGDEKEFVSNDQNTSLDPTVSLKVAFNNEEKEFLDQNHSSIVTLDLISNKEKNSSSFTRLSIENLPNNYSEKPSDTSQKVFLGEIKNETSTENILNRKLLAIGDASKVDFPPVSSNETASELIFNDKKSSNFENPNLEGDQQVSFEKSSQKNTQVSDPVSNGVELSTSGVKKEYGSIRSFLQTGNEVDSPSSLKDGNRDYSRLRNWRPTQLDSNRSLPLSGSKPKQFNRAMDWIRKKGRIAQE